MQIEHKIVANWANYPTCEADIATPADEQEAINFVRTHERLIARGNGKCYGDAALSPTILSTLALNKIQSFDAHTGIVDCQAGVMLADLVPVIVPAGWFFHVTPGIKSITVGGAIASDVHGKNHPTKGCFSNWLLDFRLLKADGSIVTCSRSENSDLFWQTCGGMGWTGVILSARFQLMRIVSTRMRQHNVMAGNLGELLEAFEANRDRTYAAGWLDCTATGKSFGRGAVFFAEHESAPELGGGGLEYKTRPGSNVRFFAPSWVLNPLSIRLHNYIYNRNAHKPDHWTELDQYFYPLDRVQNWNRFYGRRGFIQYQCCIPEAAAAHGLKEVVHTIRKSRDLPFLSVLKRHGERPPEAIHSFPIAGYSLALDFPRTRSIFGLIQELDRIVDDLGGKIYLTKDACSKPTLGRVDPATFGEDKFYSLQKARLLS